MPETITSRDAARFPIIASCTLFGLYLFFKVSWGLSCYLSLKLGGGVLFKLCAVDQVFSQEYINLLLSVYFFVLGVLALSHTMR